MLYRIYTERINVQKVCQLVSKRYAGFTLLDANGYWENEKEKSLIVEIIGDEKERESVRKLASEIKVANSQQAVLVQELKNNNYIV
jgi:hypothetical protein